MKEILKTGQAISNSEMKQIIVGSGGCTNEYDIMEHNVFL